ncbi:MAG: hypothetical protein LBP38_09185, partial [Desulfovibrio sp.]|nr:hypothetical protein [Desulfovibrio sp.]
MIYELEKQTFQRRIVRLKKPLPAGSRRAAAQRPYCRGLTISAENNKYRAHHKGSEAPGEEAVGPDLRSHTRVCSIIGDEGLNFRVRN